MMAHGFAQHALSGRQITMFTEPGSGRVTNAVDGAVKNIYWNLAVGFVHVPIAADCPLAPTEALQQHGREVNDPAMNRRVVAADATPGHHLFQVA